MSPTIQLQLLLITFAGWVGRQQTSVIQYLVEENRVLKEQLDSSGRRMLLTDDQRRRLAVRGRAIGRRALAEVAITGRGARIAWRPKET